MSGRNKKINGPLLCVCLLLSGLSAVVFTSSSYSPEETGQSYMTGSVPDTLGTIGSLGDILSSTKQEEQEEADTLAVTPTDVPSPTPVPRPIASTVYEVSPEARQGIWEASGTGWIFTVDGVPYQGWLTDVDGKRYYLGDDYYMATGWITVDGNTYYLDMDGIMQTGEVTIGKETYQFDPYGVLVPEEEEPQEKKGKTEKEEKVEKAGEKESEKEEQTPQTTEEAVNGEEVASEEPQAAIRYERGERGAVALTFDDGPGDFTMELLDILEENHAHATFFMVGKEIEERPEVPQRMVSLGMELGNHTYDHSDLTLLDANGIETVLMGTDRLLLDHAGAASSVVRPPYGYVNETVQATVGKPLIMWSVDTDDWESEDVEKIVKNIQTNVQDGAIILMHDYYEATMEACRIAVPWLIQQGYELLNVHELAQSKGVTLEEGEVYYSF